MFLAPFRRRKAQNKNKNAPRAGLCGLKAIGIGPFLLTKNYTFV